MKKIILDSGPVISLALNNLLWLFEKVKKDYDIQFYITEAVKKELIDSPISKRRFKFEALQVLSLLNSGVITLIKNREINEKTSYLLELANSSYKARERFLNLVHFAEFSAISAFLLYEADAIMIDERTTRYMIERPDKLRNVLMHKLHTHMDINKSSLSELRKQTKNVKFIRSAEFVTIAFEKGLLDKFLPNLPNARETLLDGLLWGLKINGCAISTKDLDTIKRVESKIKK